MAARDVTCVRDAAAALCVCVCYAVCVLCRAVLCYARTCLAVLGACVFPPSFEPTRCLCHVIVLDPALPPIGPSQGAQRAETRAELSVELAQARILPAYKLGR